MRRILPAALDMHSANASLLSPSLPIIGWSSLANGCSRGRYAADGSPVATSSGATSIETSTPLLTLCVTTQ